MCDGGGHLPTKMAVAGAEEGGRVAVLRVGEEGEEGEEHQLLPSFNAWTGAVARC